MEPQRGSDVQRSVQTSNWTTRALVGAVIILGLVIAYFATMRTRDQDRLTENQIVQSQTEAKAPSAEKKCASNETYDLIKREVFRRAAQLRGSDEAAFDQLSAYAVIRMENPVMESQDNATGAVNCSGTLSLDLPPGVIVVGGHHTLTSDVDYTIQQAADGSGTVILLRNADQIIAPLATLARSGPENAPVATPRSSVSNPQSNTAAPEERPNGVTQSLPAPQPAQRTPLAAAPIPSSARPSFDCSRARSRAELSVCSNQGLAALDRNMAAQLGEAMQEANPQQRVLLESTRGRFAAYVDRCPNRSCIASAYVGRMREIRDIMAGDWTAPR